MSTKHTLDSLAPGDRARILSLDGNEADMERLMEMGVVEGTEIQVVRFAPLGDPMEIVARGTHFSLRRVEAQGVSVEKL